MQYRTLGKTGWNVSAVSMGCWGIGGQWGPVEEKQALDTINAALDAGVNLFDTADGYGLGQSEIYTGKALKSKRSEVYIATKAGNWGRRQGDPLGYKTIYSIINCCHASLYRLDTDYIDLYQCHIGTPEHPEIFVEAFELLKKEERSVTTRYLPTTWIRSKRSTQRAPVHRVRSTTRSLAGGLRMTSSPTVWTTISGCYCEGQSLRVFWRINSRQIQGLKTRFEINGI